MPGTLACAGPAAARLAALQLVEQVGGLRQRALLIEDVGDRKARGREQAADDGEIEHHRDQRRVRQRARVMVVD